MLSVTALPVDVLTSVFEVSIELSQRDLSPSLRNAPLNISQTCQSWRQLLLRESRFWSQMRFDMVSFDPRLVMAWIERSRDAILSLQIGAQARLRGSMDSLPATMMNLVLRHQSRWGTIALNNNKDHPASHMRLHDLANLIFLSVRHGFPFSVEGGASHFSHQPLFVIPSRPQITRSIAPRLKLLTCEAIECSWEAEYGVLAMLSHCSELKELRIAGSFLESVNTSDASSLSLCELPKLENINLECAGPAQLLLRSLRAPMLRNLILMAHDPLSVPEVIGFVNASNSPLKSAYYVVKGDLRENEEVAFLRALPHITDLRSYLAPGRRTCRYLSIPENGGQPCLCPDLDYLEMTAHPQSCLDDWTDVITSRSARNPRFRAKLR